MNALRAWCLVLVLVLVQALAAADDPGWTGTIEIVETFAGPDGGDGDAPELDRLARTLEERLRRSRAEAATLPPAVARVLREDVGVIEAELERVLVRRGGTIEVGRNRCLIASDRVLFAGGAWRVIATRGGGRAVGIAAGVRNEFTVRPPVPVEPAEAEPGVPVLGVQTRRVRLRSEGREYVVLLAGSLPNPYSLTLPDDGSGDDLSARLAALPGLPMVVEQRSGAVVRRIEVVRLEPGRPDPRAFDGF